MSSKSKMRFAVIGCGGISRFHFNGLAKAGARIARAVDIRPDAAQPWVDRFGAKYSSDYREAIDDDEIDAVAVTSPSRLHREIAVAALKAGKAVIVEKTLTDNPRDSLKIVEAVRETGGLCFTAYMKRFFPALQKAKELLPGLGQLISVHARSWQPWGNVWTAPLPPSDGKPSFVVANYGGGMLVCGGSHILDLVMWLVGRPVKLWANQYTRQGLDHDFRHTALMTLPDSGQAAGAAVSFEACAHPFKTVGYEKNGWDERLEINGVNGRLDIATVTWNEPEKAPALLVHTDNTTGQATDYRFFAANPFDLEMAYFVDCIRKRKQGYPSAVDGYAVDELIACITRSARTAKVIDVPFKA
ncbi:MAG TPA: Gfo/Idh/MocA family oxidoreductase [Planctomycetota bacterium]|nr:Gfo/Idh/MocA family oxidoreductase [Planctomycetota bacterium]